MKAKMSFEQLKRLLNEATDRASAYLDKLNEVLPIDFLKSIQRGEDVDKTATKFKNVYLSGGDFILWPDDRGYCVLIFSERGTKLVKDPWAKGKQGKILYSSETCHTIDDLYKDPAFAKAICSITKTKLFARPGVADKYTEEAKRLLPPESLERALSFQDANWISCELGKICPVGHGKVELYAGGSMKYVLRRVDADSFSLAKVQMCNGYSKNIGRPQVFNCTGLDELYANQEFAHEIVSLGKAAKKRADKRDEEKRAEEEFANGKTTIYFKTYKAALLFSRALCGQISDGKYENSKPYWHWKWLQNLEYDVDPSNEVGYDGPAHKMFYDCSVGLRDERAPEAVWFGALVDYCAKKYRAKFDVKYLSGLVHPVFQVFKKFSGEDYSKLTLDDFDEYYTPNFDKCIYLSGFGDKFVEMISDGMSVSHGIPNPKNYYDEASEAMNSKTSKVKLTFEQLKRLVKEGSCPSCGMDNDDGLEVTEGPNDASIEKSRKEFNEVLTDILKDAEKETMSDGTFPELLFAIEDALANYAPGLKGKLDKLHTLASTYGSLVHFNV